MRIFAPNDAAPGQESAGPAEAPRSEGRVTRFGYLTDLRRHSIEEKIVLQGCWSESNDASLPIRTNPSEGIASGQTLRLVPVGAAQDNDRGAVIAWPAEDEMSAAMKPMKIRNVF